MSQAVEITFDCLPLRSVGRFDIPLDLDAEQEAQWKRIHLAAQHHGVHNSYYLYNARCVFHLTNDPDLGMLEYEFEGTVLTDAGDQRTIEADLAVRLEREVCPWLTAPIDAWFAETVRSAVQVEFDRYIAAGDLSKTIERLRRIEAASDAQGGFKGMGL